MGFVKLDHAGMERILKHTMRKPVHEAAEKIAAELRKQGHMVGDFDSNADIPVPVTVTDYTTDRAITVVAIAHPAGAALQAKHGALTKAAAATGLEVRGKK